MAVLLKTERDKTLKTDTDTDFDSLKANPSERKKLVHSGQTMTQKHI